MMSRLKQTDKIVLLAVEERSAKNRLQIAAIHTARCKRAGFRMNRFARQFISRGKPIHEMRGLRGERAHIRRPHIEKMPGRTRRISNADTGLRTALAQDDRLVSGKGACKCDGRRCACVSSTDHKDRARVPGRAAIAEGRGQRGAFAMFIGAGPSYPTDIFRRLAFAKALP